MAINHNEYNMGDMISWVNGQNHFVGNTEKILTDRSACDGLGVDFVRKIHFDMNTSGKLTITDGTNNWVFPLAKRSKNFAKDMVYLFCSYNDEQFKEYKKD